MATSPTDLSEPLVEDDVIDHLHESMIEEGVEPHSISVDVTPQPFGDNYEIIFTVMKVVSGSNIKTRFRISLSDKELQDSTFMRNNIAMSAKKVADYFREEMREEVSVGNTVLEFTLEEYGKASCKSCGATVNFRELRDNSMFGFAESSNPKPQHYNMGEEIMNLNRGQEELLKLYLFGALRYKCQCDFGNDTLIF